MSKFLQEQDNESESESENQENQNCFKSKFLQEFNFESDADQNQFKDYNDYKQQNNIKTEIQQDNQNNSNDEEQHQLKVIDKEVNNSNTQNLNQADTNQKKNKKRKQKQNQIFKDEKSQQTLQEQNQDNVNNKKKLKVAAQMALEMQEQKRRIQQEQRRYELIQYEKEEQFQKEEQIQIEKNNIEQSAAYCHHCQFKVRNPKKKQEQLQDDIQKQELIQKFIKQQQQQQQLQQWQQQQQQQQQIKKHKKNNFQQKAFYTCSILGDFEAGKTTLIRGLINFMKKMGFQVEHFGYTYVCQPTQNSPNLFVQMQSYYPVNYQNQNFILYDRPQHQKNFLTYPNCDIAILVVDIMNGLDTKSIKDIEYLKLRKIPFIIVLNKFDRCFEQRNSHQLSYQQLQNQTKNCKSIFKDRYNYVLKQLGKRFFKAAQYWEHAESKTYIPLVPISGNFGIGYEDLLAVLVKQLPIQMLNNQPEYLVLNNKDNKENQTIIECLIINGHLQKGDYLLIAVDGYPTSIRVQKLYEMDKEVKIKYSFEKQWILVDQVQTKKAFVRIITEKLSSIFQGCQFKIANSDEAVQEAQEFIKRQFFISLSNIELDEEGVAVFAQDQASLLKLMQFLQQNKIQICIANIGIASKDQILKFSQWCCQQKLVNKKYACILAFGIQIQQDILDLADQYQIQIISDDNCFSLIGNYQKYAKNLYEDQKKQLINQTIFPCILNIKQLIQVSNPMILNIEVAQGILVIGTPLSEFGRKQVNVKQIGIVKRIEQNQQPLREARIQTGSVIITVDNNLDMNQFRWQFSSLPQLASIISRKDIDTLKEYYREDLTLQEWQLVRELKQYYSIV